MKRKDLHLPSSILHQTSFVSSAVSAIRASSRCLVVLVASFAWHCGLLALGVVHTLSLLAQGKLLGELAAGCGNG